MKKVFIKQLIEANIDKPSFASNLEQIVNNTEDGEKLLEALCGARPVITKENVEQVWKDVEGKWKEGMKGQNTPVLKTLFPAFQSPYALLIPCLYLTTVHIDPFPVSRKAEIEEHVVSNLGLDTITDYAGYNNALQSLFESDGFKSLLEGDGEKARYARIPYFTTMAIDPADYL